MSVKLVIPSNHLIFWHPLLLLPSIFPCIKVFSTESVLCIRWPKYWSFSFSIHPSNEHSGLLNIRLDWLDLFAVQGTLKSLFQHHSSKVLILVHTRTQEKGARTPQETALDLPVSVQESPVEAWIIGGLLQGQGHWVQPCLDGTFEGGFHYLHYLHHSLVSGQTTGREHSPAHLQEIGLKIYWAWPQSSE